MLLNNIIIAIDPKTYLSEYGILKKSKTSLSFLIISVSELVPGSEINNDTVGAINESPIASRSPDIIKSNDEKKTANFLFANIFLENSKRFPLFFIIFRFNIFDSRYRN